MFYQDTAREPAHRAKLDHPLAELVSIPTKPQIIEYHEMSKLDQYIIEIQRADNIDGNIKKGKGYSLGPHSWKLKHSIGGRKRSTATRACFVHVTLTRKYLWVISGTNQTHFTFRYSWVYSCSQLDPSAV